MSNGDPDWPYEGWMTGPTRLRTIWWADATEIAEVSADSTLMVLLHGLGDGADIWRPTLGAWPGKPAFPVVALDLPGHGGSGRLADLDYTENRIVDCVEGVLQAVQYSKIILVGHALGAQIALRLSGQLPNVGLTVLLDLSYTRNPEADLAVEGYIDAVRTGAPSCDGLLDLYTNRLPVADPDALREAIPGLATARTAGLAQQSAPRQSRDGPWAVPLDPAIKQLLAGRDLTRIDALLGAVSTPVALARGQFSSVLSASDLRAMSGSLPHCVGAETIVGAGHAIPLEAPAQIAQALWRWSSELRP